MGAPKSMVRLRSFPWCHRHYAGGTGRHFSGGIMTDYHCYLGESKLLVKAMDRVAAAHEAAAIFSRSKGRPVTPTQVLVLNLAALHDR